MNYEAELLAVKQELAECKEELNKWRSEAEKTRKNSDEKFRALIDQVSNISVQGYSSDGTVLFWNKASEKIYGYTEEEALGKNLVDLIIPPPIREPVREAIHDMIERGVGNPSEELTLLRKDGSPAPVYSSHTVLTSPNGENELFCVDIDLSDLKKLDEERKLFQKRIEHAQKIAGLGFWDWNIVTDELYWSSEVFVQLGFDPETYKPSWQGSQTFIHPDNLDRMNSVLEKLFQEGMNFIEDIKILRQDGTVAWIHAIAEVVRDDEGKPIRFFGVQEDVTEQKLSIEKLRESEQKFRFLTESMKDVVWVLDTDTMRFLYVSPSVEQLRGFTPEEILTESLEAALDNESSAYVREITQKRAAQLRSGEIPEGKFYINEVPQPCKDGSTVMTEVITQFSINKITGRVEVLGVTRDITDRKKAEEELRVSLEKYRVLFESFPLGITITDNTGKIIESNLESERLLGISRDEHLVRKSDGLEWNIVHPNGTTMPVDEYASVRALKENRTISNVEMGILKPNDEITWINVTASPIPLENYGVAITYDDITHRIAAQEQLRETTEYLENLFNYANAPIIVWDNDLRITRFNKSFEQLTGRTAEEVIGKRIEILFPADKIEKSIELIEKTSLGERWETIEIEIQHIDGSIKVVLWNSANVYDRLNEKIVATIAQGQDITERKHSEEQLRETTEYLENLFNYANAPIIVWDNDLRITRFNKSFEQLTGRTAAEVIGKRIEILFPADKIEKSIELIEKTSLGERWETIEIEILNIDGSVKVVLWNSANVYDRLNEKIVATIAQGQDITERKHSEEQLRETTEYLENLFNYANAPIIVWDNDLRITRFNKSFEQLTGRAAVEVIGKRIEILFPADKIEKSIELIEKTSLGERWETIEIEIQNIDGSVKVVLWNSANVYDRLNEKIVATIAQGQDITERKQYENQLTEYTEELKKMNATKDKLFSIIAHDLRSPFHPLLGISSLLKDNYESLSSEEIGQYAGSIQTISKKVFGLLQNLLEWAAAQSGKIQYNPVHINLSAKATEIIQTIKENCTRKSIEVQTHIEIGLAVSADDHMLTSVLHNLLTNAIKFTPTGGKISVAAKADEAHPEERMIIVSVEDTGVGITPNRVERLFRVEQFETTKGTNREEGSGLGLALCKEFVELHGGKIWVESTVGTGSTFFFTVKKAE